MFIKYTVSDDKLHPCYSPTISLLLIIWDGLYFVMKEA